MTADGDVNRFQRPTTARLLVIVIVSLLVGASTRLLYDFYLHQLWIELTADRRLTDWLVSQGLDDIAARSGFICLYLPEWLLGSMVGIGVGLALGRNWWTGAIPCSLAFLVSTEILLHVSGEGTPYELYFMFGTSVAVQMILYEVLASLLLLLTAYLGSKLVRN